MSRRPRDFTVIAYLAFLGVMMAFGIDVALPAFDELRAEFDTDARGVSVAIIGTLYLLGTAAGQLFWGALADRFGRRNVMLVGIALYAAGAFASALAPNLEVLLAARLVWGLGAAAPYVLRLAIVRDLYDGDRMARIVTVTMAVFLLGPIFVPIIGEGILTVGSWQTVFLGAVLLAVVAFGWTAWFGEPLDPARRQPLSWRPYGRAIRSVFTTRATIGHIVAATLLAAPFFSYLGSAQPIVDRIYGRADQFAFLFAGSGVLMALTLLASNKLIARHGTRRMVPIAGAALVVASAAGIPMVVLGGGVPPLWAWLLWVAVSNAISVVLAPMCSALALEPMAEIAGTASAVLGFITLAFGAALGAVIDNLIDDTVTPMVLGYSFFSVAAFAALRWSRPSGSYPISSGISALRRSTYSRSSSSTASSIGGGSYEASAAFHALLARSAALSDPSSSHCS